jgi:3,4-dihydroxy 2-butanone 4-phosphate synthase/GTP cyclohydrolase II
MHPDLVRRTTSARIPTAEGSFQLAHYVDTRDGKEHLALIMGQVAGQENVPARVHSECFTGDVLGSQRCDCGEQLHQAMRIVAEHGQGVILYLRQEGRGIGLEEKLKAYNLQDQGYDTVDANLMLGHQADEREYSAAAAILKDLGVLSIRLMTNNPAKIDHLERLGVAIRERMPLAATVTHDNAAYLATKIQRMRHLLTLPAYTNGHHAHDKPKLEVDALLATLHERTSHFLENTGRPHITLSYAQTLDGTIGTLDGGPLRISGAESMLVTHQLRAHHDAILIGIGTLLADDPRLTVRLVEGASPQPVIVDTHLRTPLNAQIWSHPLAPWIATVDVETPAANLLREQGARLLPLPLDGENRVDMAALFANLGSLGIRSVMVEGGATMIESLLRRQLVDYAVITVAPRYQSGTRINGLTATTSVNIQTPIYTQAGTDIIMWGSLEWSESAGSNSIFKSEPSPVAASPTVSSAI